MDILIIKPSSLGDIIHGLQVAESIREQLFDIKIDWVVKERFREIVEGCSTVDRVLIYKHGEGLISFINLIKQICQKRYDYILDFQGLLRSGLMTFFAKGSKKLGRSDGREGSVLFYQQKVPLPTRGKMAHAVDILLEFLPIMGLKKELLGNIQYAIGSLGKIDNRLNGASTVLLIPHSRQKEKEWYGFRNLAKRILEENPNVTVVWDSHIKTEIDELEANPRFVNTTGKTGIRDMVSLVSQSQVVVANDSGPMHLAAAMGIPIIALFGPTSKERFGPYPLGRNTNIILEAPEGQLSKLTVAKVYQALRPFLIKEKPANDKTGS